MEAIWKAYELSDDRSRIDRDFVHRELTKSYWAEGISRTLTDKAIENAMCFGIYTGGQQVAFARVITDHATFAYLCDVVVTDTHRRKGLGKWLMQFIMAHPDLQGLRRFMLATRDAHTLYHQFGFTPPAKPENLLEIARPGLYKQATS